MDYKRALIPLTLITFLMLGFQNCGESWIATQAERPDRVLPASSTSVQVSGGFNIGRDYVIDYSAELEELALPGQTGGGDLEAQVDLPVVLEENLSEMILTLSVPGEASSYVIEKVLVYFSGEGLTPLLYRWEPSDIEPDPPSQFDFTMLRGLDVEITAWMTTESGAKYLYCSQVVLSGQQVNVDAEFESYYPQNPDLAGAIPTCPQ